MTNHTTNYLAATVLASTQSAQTTSHYSDWNEFGAINLESTDGSSGVIYPPSETNPKWWSFVSKTDALGIKWFSTSEYVADDFGDLVRVAA